MSNRIRSLIFGSLLCATCFCGRAADQPYTIAVIPKGTTHEFWKSINAGAVKAQRELTAEGTKLDIIWKGPLREDDRDQQIQVVENFMARHVSAIVLGHEVLHRSEEHTSELQSQLTISYA